MIKKVIIDKANRLFQMPPDIFSFTKDNQRKPIIKKSELLDLGHFNWPVDLLKDSFPDENGFTAASKDDINNLKETLSDWFSKTHNIKLAPSKEIYIGGSISNNRFCKSMVNSRLSLIKAK